MRAVSRALFGGATAFEALVVMADLERFYLGDLTARTKGEGSYLSGLLKKLVDLELIEEEKHEDGQRRKYYRVCPSRLWPFVLAWAADLNERAAPGAVARIA